MSQVVKLKRKEEGCLERLMTYDDVAELLQVHPASVRAMKMNGEIPYIQVSKGRVRFSPSAIQEWINERSRT